MVQLNSDKVCCGYYNGIYIIMLPESGIFMYRCDEVQNVCSNLHIFIDMHSWVPAEIFVGGGGGGKRTKFPT